MSWNRWYSFKSYVRSALWIVPLVSLLLFMVVSRITQPLGDWLVERGAFDQTSLLALSMAGAQNLLETTVTMTLSFLVFTFGSLLVAIQVAGGQYTPRIIATTLLRDNAIRYTVGLFVFTLLFANRALNKMDTTVDQFQLFLSASLGMLCIVTFLYLIDYAARLLRPVSLVGRIAEQGIAVIESVYGSPAADVISHEVRPAKRKSKFLSWLFRDPAVAAEATGKRGAPDRTICHRGKSAIVLAVNLQILVAEAQRADSVVEFAPQVGDFVAVGEPLFHLYGNAGAVVDQRLHEAVAFGAERTIEQDPMFAFRILVDIALKALSPAINDPTTAVLALDQIHRLLRMVGLRHLHTEEIVDREGQTRVIFRTPNWEDFVHIAFTEIRQCGAGSVQVARRLRAMVENLIGTLPERRHAELQHELALLERAIEKSYTLREDLALARIPDSQGLGGASGAGKART